MDTEVPGQDLGCEEARRARMIERRMIMSHLAEGHAFAAYFKSNLPYCTEEDAFKLIKYYKVFLTLTDRLREFGEELRTTAVQLLPNESPPALLNALLLKFAAAPAKLGLKTFLVADHLMGRLQMTSPDFLALDKHAWSPLPLCKVCSSCAAIQEEPKALTVGPSTVPSVSVPPAKCRARLQRPRANAAVAALHQDRLRMESDLRAATLYKQALRREVLTSEEYQDYVESSRWHHVVAAKDAKAAAWKHAFAVARQQGVSVSGAPAAVLRKKRRVGESDAECAARFTQRLKEAKLNLEFKAAQRGWHYGSARPTSLQGANAKQHEYCQAWESWLYGLSAASRHPSLALAYRRRCRAVLLFIGSERRCTKAIKDIKA
ncbi:hypothetical protein C8F04DRAFT_1199618 [Mycena alexandri]|uniref:Uncharacterized protein n=1 Tax=Mycena alexandri TaxID=1745969 RepID=A0AAD6RZ67_9AGAR|nr:hypothetical protein C8F04DRAFT_1199618 [Mycena alexandri]